MNSPFIFSRLHDEFVAGAAFAQLLAGARAAGDSGDAFELAFANTLTAQRNIKRTFLQARDGDLTAGMLILVMDASVTLPGIAQVRCILTEAAYRRKGIATQLLRLAGKLAAENDKPIVTIHTAVAGHPAAFFTSAGFAVNSIEPGFASLPDGRITDTVTYWKNFDGK